MMEETQTLLLSVRGEVEMFMLGIPTSGGMTERKDVGIAFAQAWGKQRPHGGGDF